MSSTPTILIVDDNPHITKLLVMNLEKEGYHVIHADNGETGLEMVLEQKPDLVIADVMMPKLDGISMCQKIRTESDTPMVPFMFLSGIEAEVTQKRGFRAGADQYLVKSEINKDILLGKVQDLLKRKNRIDEIDAPKKATFTGDLSELSLIEILQLLHIHKKTGTLGIRRPHYPEAKIFVDKGEIIRAELGDDTDERAMFTMSVWKRGTFDYTEALEPNVPRSVKTPTSEIILESFRVQST